MREVAKSKAAHQRIESTFGKGKRFDLRFMKVDAEVETLR